MASNLNSLGISNSPNLFAASTGGLSTGALSSLGGLPTGSSSLLGGINMNTLGTDTLSLSGLGGTGLSGLGADPLAMSGLGGSGSSLAGISRASITDPLGPSKSAVQGIGQFMIDVQVADQQRKAQKALAAQQQALAAAAPQAAPQDPSLAATGADPTAVPMTQQAATTAAPGGRTPRVAQIDDFFPDATGFNHGQQIGQTINPDGSIALDQYNIGGGGDRMAKISSALDQIIAQAQSGQPVDAVNISQQAFGFGAGADEVRAKINMLTQMGVPVDVAAGNNGPNQKNDLAAPGANIVASTTNGMLNANSGIGNVSAEASTTSFATAIFSRQVALRENGLA